VSRFRAPGRRPGPSWWEYFGTFGNDIFTDEDPDEVDEESTAA
jgi:hypothetical protein